MRLTAINSLVAGSMQGRDVDISSFSIDTRTLQKGDLYIAIKGARYDGADFLHQAEQAGAAAVLVEKNKATAIPKIVVNDSHQAMLEVAHAWRKQSGAVIIGVTGSNGKTTVKEMCTAILQGDAEVLSTSGNLNNEIGVPLTLLRLQKSHQFGVIEMGANHPGEIRRTSQCAAADIVIITNVGEAHIEGFGDLDGVAAAKGEIIATLADDGTVILNSDDKYFTYWHALAGSRRIITFGLSESADVWASGIKSILNEQGFNTEFTLHIFASSMKMQITLPGRHNVMNALAASAACVAAGIGMVQIKHGLEKTQSVTGRLQTLKSRQGSIVIDDSYNANPSSLKVALDVLMACAGEPWVVLGAFGELGELSRSLHEEMGELIKSMSVVRLLATGPDAENTVRVFGKGAVFFPTQEQLIATLRKQLTGNEAVLIKGSRAQHMENVVAALVDNFRN